MQMLATPKTQPWSQQRTTRDTPPSATVKLERKSFVQALTMLARITPKNPSMAVAGYLHITTKADVVTLTATDFELTLTTHLRSLEWSTQTTEIDLLVPCLELERVLKTSEGKYVLLEQLEQRARISCEQVSFELPCRAPSSFPGLVPHGAPTVRLDADQLSKALGRVLYAADKRSFGGMAGVQLELSAQRSRVVSTDGYRLALADFDAPRRQSPTANLQPADLLPAKYLILTAGARTLGRLFKSGEVSIAVTKNHLVCSTEAIRLTLRLHDRPFPDYAQVIPAASEFKITTDRTAVLEAIKHLRVNHREASILALSINASSMTMLLHDGDRTEHQIVAVESNAQDAIRLEYDLARFTEAVANADERFDMAFSRKGVTVISNQGQTLMALLNPRRF